jgi:exonuclease SbcD
MKLFHFADTHVGSKTHGKRNPKTGLNSRLHDAQDRIRDLAEISNEKDAGLVLFAGDGFEHPNPTPTQQRLFLDGIKSFNAPVIATVGNHDVPATEGRSHAMDFLREVENVILIDEPTVVFVSSYSTNGGLIVEKEVPPQAALELVLTVLPWPLEHQAPEGTSIRSHYLDLIEEGQEAAGRLGVPAYLMGHFTTEGALPSGSEESLQLGEEPAFSPGSFAGYDYVALGHIHQHQSPMRNVVYPSCPMRKSFSEEKDRKGGVFISDHKRPQNWSFEEVEARPFVTVEEDLRALSGSSDASDDSSEGTSETDKSPTEALKDAAEETLASTENPKDPIVRVRYRATEDQPVDERAIEETLNGAHKIASIEREVERERSTRSESGLGASASTEELVRAYAQSRDLGEIEDDLVEKTRELAEL